MKIDCYLYRNFIYKFHFNSFINGYREENISFIFAKIVGNSNRLNRTRSDYKLRGETWKEK